MLIHGSINHDILLNLSPVIAYFAHSRYMYPTEGASWAAGRCFQGGRSADIQPAFLLPRPNPFGTVTTDFQG